MSMLMEFLFSTGFFTSPNARLIFSFARDWNTVFLRPLLRVSTSGTGCRMCRMWSECEEKVRSFADLPFLYRMLRHGTNDVGEEETGVECPTGTRLHASFGHYCVCPGPVSTCVPTGPPKEKWALVNELRVSDERVATFF